MNIYIYNFVLCLRERGVNIWSKKRRENGGRFLYEEINMEKRYAQYMANSNICVRTSLKTLSSAADVSAARTRRKTFFTSGWTLSIFSKSTACNVKLDKKKDQFNLLIVTESTRIRLYSIYASWWIYLIKKRGEICLLVS
jgi:hypothetical protein